MTASDDMTARIRDAQSGKQQLVLKGHKLGVWSAVFSPDGELVATTSVDTTARVWNARVQGVAIGTVAQAVLAAGRLAAGSTGVA